eukprot:1343605-Amorphochlora_amoeboformis.AAC.2
MLSRIFLIRNAVTVACSGTNVISVNVIVFLVLGQLRLGFRGGSFLGKCGQWGLVGGDESREGVG